MASVKLLERSDGLYALAPDGAALLNTDQQLKLAAVLGCPRREKSILLNSLLGHQGFQSEASDSTNSINILSCDDVVMMDTPGADLADQDQDISNELYSIVFTLADVIILVVKNAEVSQGFLSSTLQQAFRSVITFNLAKKHLLLAFATSTLSESQKTQAIGAVLACWFQALGSHIQPIHEFFQLEAVHLVLDATDVYFKTSSVESIKSCINGTPASNTGYQILRKLEILLTQLNNQRQPTSRGTHEVPRVQTELNIGEYLRFVQVFLDQKLDAVGSSIGEAYAASRPKNIEASLIQFLENTSLKPALIEKLTRDSRDQVDAIQQRAMELLIQYTLADLKFQYFKMDACELANSQFRVLCYASRLKALKQNLYANLGSDVVARAIKVKVARFQAKLKERLRSLRSVAVFSGSFIWLGTAAGITFGSGTAIAAMLLMGVSYYAYDWGPSERIQLNAFPGHMQALQDKLRTFSTRVKARAPMLMFEIDRRNARHDFAEFDLEFWLLGLGVRTQNNNLSGRDA